jgi:ribose transport system ATP-binding protein
MTSLDLTNTSKVYEGIHALRSVSLSVAAGEIHALMGENGAGKSTLIKILAGVVRADTADIAIDGQAVTIDGPNASFRHGLRFIHQELSVVPTVSVAENIFLGRAYPRRLGALVAWDRLASEARSALARIGVSHIEPTTKMARLSFGDRMLVRIASAFLDSGAVSARLYVMDEPTAALTAGEAERLFRVLREIRRMGGSVLYVSHRLDEVMGLCDRVTVLRDGASVATKIVTATSREEIIQMMIGRRIAEAYPRAVAPVSNEIAVDVRDLRGAGVGPVSFEIRKGEIVGLAGLAGAGQSEVLRLLMGATRANGGTINLGGRERLSTNVGSSWRSGFAYIPPERRAEALVLSMTVAENVTLPHLRRLSHGGAFLARRRERALARDRGIEVRLKSRSPRQRCHELSGGNQQKVAFAKALAGNPRVLLLDEPTRGVDVGAKFDIYSVVRQMSATGVAVLLASSDFPELVGMCDRIIVMQTGRVAAVLQADGLSEETLLAYCYERDRRVAAAAVE